ncbi:MAG: N-acetylglucosamine-6-phosphate deacetylase [uncultured Chloroflexi bacterium]|uniref:N-acetylglucosamine-6-phosphate deacetylase n=1 Tax=uncultured Chloroflexota bacterium TaxID=166587 RepID=A0A6J4JEM3_9CHLR|nr:MAG: N-acetylglucosamine-6-phosphate deacetylase [uncultured Chloroflexota bacterium]
MNRLAVLAGDVVASDKAAGAGGLVLREGKIERLLTPREEPPSGTPVLDFRPHLIAPGTIDVHTHGAVERSFSSGPPEDTLDICRYRATTGATGLLATITGEWDELLAALDKLGAIAGPVDGGATLLGIHIEGPFLNPARKGAIAVETMRPPLVDELRRMQDAAHGQIRMMTVAPEVPGALPVIEAMARLGIVPSIGHSDATYEEALAGAEAGVRKSTHTYNAMRPLHHRDPGAVGAVLADDRIVAELIADGVHVAAGAMAVLLRAKGPRRVALVTDGVRYAGLADGVYERPGRGRLTVSDGAAVLDDGTIAGSVSPMNRNLRLLRDTLDVPIADLFTMAAAVPAVLLGLTGKGELKPGADADFAVYDDQLTCLATFIGGRQVYAQR